MTREPTTERARDQAAGTSSQPLELTIVMPCLNEAETLAACIQKARLGLERAGVRGEILIADNGSTDGSVAIAREAGGARGAGEGKGLWQRLARRHRSRPGQMDHHGRCRRQLRFLEHRRVRGEVSPGLRPGDGMPAAQRRRHHPAGGHAVEEPLDRQSGSFPDRPGVLQVPGAGFPLRAARVHQGGLRGRWT